MNDNDTASAGDDEMRLLLDAMLGKLATYLRVCGFDTAYALDRDLEDDDELLSVALEEGRILLTRDRTLAREAAPESPVESDDSIGEMKTNAPDAPGSIRLHERAVTDQLAELAAIGFDLTPADHPRRCGRCNGRLRQLDPDESKPDYAPEELPIWRCHDCGQCFWMGSHWDDIVDRLEDL